MFGRCPKCLGVVVKRERRFNGNDICERGCTHPSKDTLALELPAPRIVATYDADSEIEASAEPLHPETED
jgi:hypothetical protein